jgi:NAD(P)-dependent dehydrogenase (short-subunit alcohol dehydrogenase family)
MDLDIEHGTDDKALSGKVALVTGGSRGVGAVTARLLAESGADVAINYRDKARRAEQVAAQVAAVGSSSLLVQADITNQDSVEAMVAKIQERFDSLDILILNASGGLEKDVAEDYAMLLNRDAQVGLVQKALPLMPVGGRVVFVTSHLAHFHGEQPVLPEYEPVAASKKAGEVALRALIPDLVDAGVSLVVVSGDLIDGTITPKLLDRMRPGMIDQRRSEVGWLPTTEDFAQAIVDAAISSELKDGDTVYVGSID